jgi:tetratricopeptide (TPR) repeat protein
LTPGAPTVPSQAANPFVGLYSNTYLALPEISTKNRYEIISDQPIKFDEISFIGDPANHTLTPIDDRTFSLSVQAGGTDGTSPPSQRDLDSNMYIETSSPLITAALAYLKSAGAEGNLPPHRRENALVVISGISRLTARRAIWKSPDETARWIMRYVYAILPDKQHTHTMKTATQALLEGQGDCTEHSVLFAALMRAAGVPTRLVSGIYLARGGAWVYHMWNEYWDGSRWQSIDTAVGPFFRTGAHYIALGPGVSDFADHRSKIAFFLDTAFSGFSINLVEATADGQILHLVQPTRQHIAFSDKTVFMATTALKRGKPDRALEIVEKNYPARHPPLRLQILRADLLFQNGRHEEALQMIHALRQITSLPVNVVFLDMLEYRVLLTLKQFKAADAIHASLCPPPGDHNPYCTVMHARGLEAEGRFDDALAAIDQSLAEHEDSVELRIALLSLLANPAGNFSAEELARGEAIGDALLFDTHYADTEALIHMTRLLFRAGRLQAGIPWLFHSLLLSPGDPTLRRLRDIATGQCPSLHETPPLF